jgi:hypothetical protein
MDNVQKNAITDYNAPLSEPFRLHSSILPSIIENSVDCQWDKIIFSDKSTFSSANDGPVSAYRPWGEHYNSQYVSNSTHSGHVSVYCWGWISHEGAGILHCIVEHLDGLQYKHILKHVMVPSVRMLYPDGVIWFQQEHSSIHNPHIVQEWLSQQTNVGLIDWPPRALDMNPIKNMWSEVNKTMQETWPDLPPRNRDALWTLVSDTWDEVASSQRHVRSVIESVVRQITSVVVTQGFWRSN